MKWGRWCRLGRESGGWHELSEEAVRDFFRTSKLDIERGGEKKGGFWRSLRESFSGSLRRAQREN